MGKDSARRRRAVDKKKRQRKERIKRAARPLSRAERMRLVASYPLHECLMHRHRASYLAQVLISRRRHDGGFGVGFFLVDMGCLGVKDTIVNDALGPDAYQELIDGIEQQNPIRPCDPAYAVKLVLTAVDYAAGLGFKPGRDYRIAKEIFGDIDPATSSEEVVCGHEGKPMFIAGPHDNVNAIMRTLTKKLGPGGFHYTTGHPILGDSDFDPTLLRDDGPWIDSE